ncbi:hypothetical protein L1987_35250 [Smallanthus sonchifolius]|uniref:Uncharacterized protein n=1 Tax=Smallanthus sonchifolius TaxID=185202 RepID=A0ACB9HVG9_9ASTR|nr:hypothetical protein L1987_35250 [Smallanthus sonchifolius]
MLEWYEASETEEELWDVSQDCSSCGKRYQKPGAFFPPVAKESSKSFKFASIGSCFKGVLETIRVDCAGYPTRRAFFEFVNRFGLLAPEALTGR